MQLRVVAVMTLLSVTALGVACGGTAPDEPRRLTFERYSPPQHTSRDGFLAASGDVIVMSRRISHDGGATWTDLDSRFGEVSRVAVHGSIVALHARDLGLVRWDLATDAVTEVTGEPGYASDRTWRLQPVTGELIVFDAVNNRIAFERGGAWQASTLPQPTATELLPYVKDLESNGSVAMTVSAWGVHRSSDGGATWQLVTANVPGAGRDLLVLNDRRFLLLGGPTTYMFDATGQPTGSMPGITVELGEASVCDDGAIVARNKISRDLGASWQELLPGGDLTMVVDRVGCGGGRYWVLARSDAWGFRLVRIDGAGAPAIAVGNWEGGDESAWAANGPPITRTADGTFLVAGLAWQEGHDAWTLREIPARTWSSGDTLFGVARPSFYTSRDAGATWTARAATGLAADDPEAFAVGPDGALYVSRFTGEDLGDTDRWTSNVWRSTDEGLTWSVAYDGLATRNAADETTGSAHRFVGIRPDGTWIATDAVSRDEGQTWETTGVKGDRSLAFLMPNGNLVTTLPASTAKQDLWRVYSDSGLGDLQATYMLEVDDDTVPGSQLRSVAFDDQGYAYVARGAPYVQIWRSTEPL